MLKLAFEIWGLLKPDEKPPSIWLAVKARKLGCSSLPEALLRVSQSLLKQGKIPAVIRGKDVLVRQQLCPSSEDAVATKRHTVWCQVKSQKCQYLKGTGDDWVKCGALGLDREGWDPQLVDVVLDDYPPKKADLLMDTLPRGPLDTSTPSKDPKKSTLSGILKILGPAVLTGLGVWHQMQRREKALRRRMDPASRDPQYDFVRVVLKANRKTFSYDTSTRTFKFPKGSIKLTPRGGAVFVHQGKRFTATKKDFDDSLFNFVAAL